MSFLDKFLRSKMPMVKAEVLFKFIEPALRAEEYCRGGRVVIRRGGPQAPKREVVL